MTLAPSFGQIEPMRIAKAETVVVEIPFTLRGSGVGIMPTAWKSLEFALVRLTDDRGNVGWGEGFGYHVADATRSLMERLLLPTLVGTVIDDIAAWNQRAQRQVHMFGRFGSSVFAIGGIDIALWDLAARRADRSLAELLGGRVRETVPIYGSLVRYGEDELVRQAMAQVTDAGFDRIKLHEVDVALIETAREVLPDASIAADVNCGWSSKFLRTHERELAAAKLEWVEEPIFPPEDYEALASLRGGAFPIAAGENLSTARQCEQMLAANAVDVFQPSVTKVGGISQMWLALSDPRCRGLRLCPHTPYFGAGLYAAMQITAARDDIEALEWIFLEPEAWMTDVPALRDGATLALPAGPGHGFVPDPAMLERYGR